MKILNINKKKIKNIHLIGIGGSGMSGIAEILIKYGYTVSGSDICINENINYLSKFKIPIYTKHCAKNINNADIIVFSSAINLNNPEIIESKKRNIPIIHRSKMLSILMNFFKKNIVISGTHGKTTTAAMISNIYEESGLNPSFIIGDNIKNLGKKVQIGCNKYFIIEADESDKSFLFLKKSTVSVVTNIEKEHMDTYDGKFQNLKTAFINFLHNVSIFGYVVACIDSEPLKKIVPLIQREVITYGIHRDSDIRIGNIYQNKKYTYFSLYREKKILKIKLSMFGMHNILNATAAIVVALKEGIKNKKIISSMLKFMGVSRRFDSIGYYNLIDINKKMGKFLLIEDYGHHPTEILVTIQTIKHRWPKKRIIMVFQPHRYSRTKNLFKNFLSVLSKVDVLLILDIYPSGEVPIPGITSKILCRKIKKIGKINPIFTKTFYSCYKVLKSILKNDDLIVMQGAGDIGNFTKTLVKKRFLL